MHPRQRLRLSTFPQLYEFGRKPSLAPTTTSEVKDEDIGLKPDDTAQGVAERYVRAAIAYHLKQAEKAEAAKAAQRTQIIIAAEELQISVEIAEDITNELGRLTASSATVSAGFTSQQSKPPSAMVSRPRA